jgi:PAS domain S-box-containing protein
VRQRGQLDLVLRELEDVNASLADVRPAENGNQLAALRERLLACASMLEDVEADARGSHDEVTHALVLERRRYQRLFELAPIAYLITDANAKIEEANTAAGLLFGVEPRWLVGKPLAVYVARDDRRAFRELLVQLRRSEVAGERELSFEGHGVRFVGSVAVAHVLDEPRESSLRWIVRDVTDRRRAEDESRRLTELLESRVRERTLELEHERALLDAVIQQMPAGVMITDASSGQLLIANAQAWEIARERFEESEGLEPLLRAAGDGVDSTTEILELGAEGEDGAIEITSAPLRDGDGAVTARVAVFRDVTARDRLERAEREFVTNAAHELQTPLTAITSAAEVLQAGAKEDPRDRDRFLTHIQRECDRLARLVRALLVLARAQAGAQTADSEEIALRPLLADVAASLRPTADVEVSVHCSSRLIVSANRDLLEQALASLAANAAKYTTAGSIRLEARRAGRGRTVLEVADTGAGISPAELEVVRQRFYRGGRRDRTGFGLGLAIAEQAAKALGGTLELEPGPDGGTLARLIVPSAVR